MANACDTDRSSLEPPEAPLDCDRCPRLAAFRKASACKEPDWFNAPVPSFGNSRARLLIVGLAPGLQGANRTGRPFTGDYAGDLLFATLANHGWTRGQYAAHAEDGLKLNDCMITNAVRCVPPQNKPTSGEIKNCRSYFHARLNSLTRLSVILALGRVAHDQILDTLALRKSAHPFGHGRIHDLADAKIIHGENDIHLIDSFHCSRYNTNTRRLTPEMFDSVFVKINDLLQRRPAKIR